MGGAQTEGLGHKLRHLGSLKVQIRPQLALLTTRCLFVSDLRWDDSNTHRKVPHPTQPL